MPVHHLSTIKKLLLSSFLVVFLRSARSFAPFPTLFFKCTEDRCNQMDLPLLQASVHSYLESPNKSLIHRERLTP